MQRNYPSFVLWCLLGCQVLSHPNAGSVSRLLCYLPLLWSRPEDPLYQPHQESSGVLRFRPLIHPLVFICPTTLILQNQFTLFSLQFLSWLIPLLDPNLFALGPMLKDALLIHWLLALYRNFDTHFEPSHTRPMPWNPLLYLLFLDRNPLVQ